jgi:methylmalonyl-CoA mutase
MTKAIELGLPKMRIEEAAAKRQANIDSGKEVIVGLNAYQSKESEDVDILEIDNNKVKKNQIQRIQKIKSIRNQHEVNQILNELSNSAKNNNGNLLEITIRAAKARATLGEISYALEKEFGRYKATVRSISGV